MTRKAFVTEKILWLDAHRPPSKSSSSRPRNPAAVDGLDQNFSDHDLFELLFDNCVADKMPAGRHLFLQEDKSDRIFGLVRGSVEISIYSIDGKKLVANMLQAPNIIGEIGALDGGLRTATAICRVDSDVVSLDRAQLLRRIETSPLLARSMLRLVCRRVRWVSESLGDQAFFNIDVRLAKRLLLLNEIMVDDTGWIAVSQNELAEFLSATRESVNKLLNAWRGRALIDLRRGRIKVNGVRGQQGLRQIATQGDDAN
jgi:CRP/FNR family cyclic AMP-dependent transcriptional regulator